MLSQKPWPSALTILLPMNPAIRPSIIQLMMDMCCLPSNYALRLSGTLPPLSASFVMTSCAARRSFPPSHRERRCSRVPAPIACGRQGRCPISVASSNQRSTFSNHNLRLGRLRVSQGWLRHQLSRSALRRPPKRWTSQRTLVRRQPPQQGVERALKHLSPSLQMEKVPRNQLPPLRSRRVWSRKWLTRYFRKRSSFSPHVCSDQPRLPPSQCFTRSRGTMQVKEQFVVFELWAKVGDA